MTTPWIRLLVASLMIVCLADTLAAQTGQITGVVYDSLHKSPLSGASVVATAEGAHDSAFHGALTDSRGRFILDGLAQGRYNVFVEHELFDSVGVHLRDTNVTLGTFPVTLALATPSPRTLRTALCPATAEDSTLGVMLGVVRQANGEPVRNAAVVFTWSDFDVNRATATVTSKQLTVTSNTDARGIYRQCQLPIARSVFVQAQGDALSHSGILEETLGNAGIQVRDLRIVVEGVATTSDSSVAPRRGVVLSGGVTDVADKPIVNAQINLPGSSRTTTTDERGVFRMADLSPGTYGVEVLALGYSPRMLRVDVDRSSPALNIRMERVAVILDSLQVIATRTSKNVNTFHREFDQRSRRGLGNYKTRAQLDSMRPMSVLDVLRRMSGVRVVRSRDSFNYIAVSTRGAVNFDSPICPLEIFVDGMKLSSDDLYSIPPQALYGIEVQSVSTAPAKYGVRSCGALFLWTS